MKQSNKKGIKRKCGGDLVGQEATLLWQNFYEPVPDKQ